MKKNVFNIICLGLSAVLITLFSYFLYVGGITENISLFLSKIKANANISENVSSNYPRIDLFVNSSGEKITNEDLVLIVNSSDDIKISKAEYSFDKQRWFDDFDEETYGKESVVKKVFRENIDKKVYLRVTNNKGYSSYVIQTIVNVDKTKPVVNLQKKGNEVLVTAKDNVGITQVQYSYDNLIWNDFTDVKFNGKDVTVNILKEKATFIRVVDKAGNISKIKEF
ncbi:MAG: hypothetical protein RSA10_00340 [Bacilli bacterium]